MKEDVGKGINKKIRRLVKEKTKGMEKTVRKGRDKEIKKREGNGRGSFRENKKEMDK